MGQSGVTKRVYVSSYVGAPRRADVRIRAPGYCAMRWKISAISKTSDKPAALQRDREQEHETEAKGELGPRHDLSATSVH